MYYISKIEFADEDYKYIKYVEVQGTGTGVFYDTIRNETKLTIKDTEDESFSRSCYMFDFLDSDYRSRVYGYGADLTSITNRHYFRAYTKEYIALDEHLISYTVTEDDYYGENALKNYCVLGDIDDINWKWVRLVDDMLHVTSDIPATVAEYIVKYANGESFWQDGNNVLCTYEHSCVVKYNFDSEARSLISKLRLLR